MTYDIARHDKTWQEIERWAKSEIERHRSALEIADDPGARGAIAQLRLLLVLGQPPKPLIAEQRDYSVA